MNYLLKSPSSVGRQFDANRRRKKMLNSSRDRACTVVRMGRGVRYMTPGLSYATRRARVVPTSQYMGWEK